MELADNLHASILDRLIDNEPELSAESTSSQAAGFRAIRESVIRDIEDLLNTTRYILKIPKAFADVDNSVFTFGLKDYSAESPNSAFFRKKLLRDVRNTIIKFEPRLKNVSVHIETLSNSAGGIGFRISGTLVVDPISEPVVFDTRFDSQRGEYHIDR